jgi:ferric-dicitrate binding protein FerR (iron transport regulator)
MNRDTPSPIESLLKLAGERDRPSDAAFERARVAAQASWRRALQRPVEPAARPPRWFTLGAWIATAAAALVAGVWLRPVAAPLDVARVAAIDGDVRLGAGQPLTADAILRSAAELNTFHGRVALSLGDALSLRVDRDTRLRLDGPGHVTLMAGAVYVDSGGLNAHTSLRIDTPAGEVRHVGTQFQVRVSADLTRVQVREGRVALAAPDGIADLAAGDVADGSGGRVRVRHGQPIQGAEWEWVAATAPVFDIENRPLSEFLAWLAREHGWQLRFADASTQSRAQAIRLHGSMAGLDAAGMVQRVALITGVPLALNDGVLWVGKRP